MNIVDSLVIALGIDPSGVKKGQKETSDALKKTRDDAALTAKEFDARAKVMAESILKVRNGVLVFTGALVSVLAGAKFFERITAADVATGRLAKTVKGATQEISTWQGMARQAGGSAEGMATTIGHLSMLMTKLKQTGSSELIPFLARARIDSSFLKDTTSWTERLLMISDAFQKMDPATRKFLGGQINMDEGAIQLLGRTRSELLKMAEQQQAMNVLTDEGARKAEAEQKAWSDLEQRWENVSRTLKNELGPSVVKVLESFGAWVDKNREFISVDIVGTIGGIGRAMGDLFMLASPVLELVAEGWKKIFTWIHGAADAMRNYRTSQNELGNGAKAGPLAHVMAFFGNTQAQALVDDDKQKAGSNRSGLLPSLEKQFGLPAGVLDAVWAQESGRGKNMRSPAGAKGHFQFMDSTAAQYGVKDPDNFEQSARGAAAMLRDLLAKYGGNLPKALAGYNWGQGNVDRFGLERAPNETMNYIASINRSLNSVRSGSGGSNSTQVHVGKIADQIVVQTNASDATGIARELGPMLRNHILSAQGASGLK